MPQKAHASPTKEFFINNLIKDISLEDCILDLLDNCLDGANRSIERKAGDHQNNGNGKSYKGYDATITLMKDKFIIKDTCGGISIQDAINYAFHFGRRPDAPSEAEYAIGLYGIGMKRAIFKIGEVIAIESSTEEEAFSVNINVPEWLAQGPEDWDFLLDEKPKWDEPGTKITITNLKEGIGEEFADNTFINSLAKSIGVHYSIFLQKGFVVNVATKEDDPKHQTTVDPHEFFLKESEDFHPINTSYVDDSGVKVEIMAGLSGFTPDDVDAEAKRRDVEYDGWYVLCNDRVVLPADKTDSTVWGDGEFPVWHYQYRGFLGIASFSSSEPSKLPWTTTKREIELSVPLYRRAVEKMKDATRKFVDYTNAKKADLKEAKELELKAVPTPVFQLEKRDAIRLPYITGKPEAAMATISYKKVKAKVLKVAKALGDRNMTNKDIGSRTFDYYYENEVED